jgi:LPS O-antigen subunit length determinant protein (WzzB/FepE family)
MKTHLNHNPNPPTQKNLYNIHITKSDKKKTITTQQEEQKEKKEKRVANQEAAEEEAEEEQILAADTNEEDSTIKRTHLKRRGEDIIEYLILFKFY